MACNRPARGNALDPILLAIARSFAARVKGNFDAPVRAQPEDQLKAPVVELIEGSGTLFARNVQARTEAQVQDLGARARTSASRSIDS